MNKLLLLISPIIFMGCCWQKQKHKKLVHYPVITAPDQPILVRVSNINEIVAAFSALQRANIDPSISISPIICLDPLTPAIDSRKRNVTPDLVMQESIILPDGPTLSRLQRSHALIETFYQYPAKQEAKPEEKKD